MEKICFEILENWAKYIDYDENQTSFNLLNYSYEAHNRTKKLSHITDDYDETGLLAVLTVKRLFELMMKNSRITLLDAINNPNEIQKHVDMYNLFESPEIKVAEKNFIDAIKQLTTKVIGKDLIGTFDDATFSDKVFRCVDNVIQTIDKCKIEFYQKGGEFTEVSNFSTSIHTFPSLADCLITLSNAPDGMYLCFMDIEHTADSYFGFFLKNNGNLISANERIDEAFKGQHCNSRNGRWAENKADQIFPYNFIFKYENYDYKGYSHTYKIDEDKLDMFVMDEDAFLPLLIAMILLAKKLPKINKDEYEVVFTDSLLKINLPLLTNDQNELMVLDKNEIVQQHQAVNLEFDYDKIMDGSALKEFEYQRNDYRGNYISASNNGQIFVDLYGKGFEVQPTVLSTTKMIGTGNYEYIPEFVGTEKRLRIGAFVDIRTQLANYIRQQMYEEYKAFGGINAVKDWYIDLINTNLDTLKKRAAEQYVQIAKHEANNYTGGWQPTKCDDGYYMSLVTGTTYVSYEHGWKIYFPNKYNRDKDSYEDLDNGCTCTIFVIFKPLNYKGIEKLFGTEVPKIVKGWSKDGHRTSGNSLLDATDPVESINVPFEKYCSRRPEYEKDNTCYDFAFAIGFSKSGFKKYCKSLGINLNDLPEIKKDEN